jgi:hypothetical protein
MQRRLVGGIQGVDVGPSLILRMVAHKPAYLDEELGPKAVFTGNGTVEEAAAVRVASIDISAMGDLSRQALVHARRTKVFAMPS